jgi:formylglycine-generating enzyme required for sulfatase activity
MLWIPGGTFRMGSENFYPEERPVHEVTVDGFWMDRFTVTNAQFACFIAATGYVTLAERPPNPADFPGAPPENLVPGSMLFHKTTGAVDLYKYANWWAWAPGTSWRHPLGPGSSLAGIEQHPVVHVAYEDAEAYARWAKKELPTEPEWEFAARGGLDGAKFTWGMSIFPTAKRWPTLGKASSPGRICSLMVTRVLRQWEPSRRTGTSSTTWRATCGNGPAPGLSRTMRRKWSSPVADHR